MKQEKAHRVGITRGYTDFAYAPIPTKFSQFMMRCKIYQLWKYIVLNLKIMRITLLND